MTGEAIDLFGYQRTAVDDIVARMNEGRRVVAVSPTGSGKTVMGAAVLRRRGVRSLWIAHRIELLRQARDELVAAGFPRDSVGIISGAETENPEAEVLVASIGSLGSRGVPDGIEQVVIDEAHRSAARTYRALLIELAGVPLLGLTATPWRLDGRGLDDTFDELLEVSGPTELIAAGFITQPVTYGLPYERAMEMVADLKVSGTDYSVKPLGRAMMRGSLMGDVVSECARLAPGQRTIVFAASREHGRALADRFREAGRSTAYLDGRTPDRARARIIRELRSGETEVVVNIDVLSEGFDCPPVKCIALARPTRSVTRFLQYVGRATRPFEGMRPVVLDHAGNCWRHGLPEAEREWSLKGRRKYARHGVAPLKRCDCCGAMLPIAAVVCPECGADALRDASGRDEADVELEPLAWPEAHVKRARTVLQRIAEREGRGETWVRRTLEQMQAAVA